MCQCERHVLTPPSPPHLTSMCFRCRQCPCLSSGWTYLHLSICLGLMSNTCRIVSRLFRWRVWPIKATQCYNESLTFLICVQLVHKPTLPMFSEGQLPSNCSQTVGLWPDWSASFHGKEVGTRAKGFAGSYSTLVNNSAAKAAVWLELDNIFSLKVRQSMALKAFLCYWVALGRVSFYRLVLLVMKSDCPVLNMTERRIVESPYKYYFEEAFPLQVLSMECFSDWHARCIPWVCETFSVACQVTAPPLDLKNWSSFIFTKIWSVFCRRGYLPYLTSLLIQ